MISGIVPIPVESDLVQANPRSESGLQICGSLLFWVLGARLALFLIAMLCAPSMERGLYTTYAPEWNTERVPEFLLRFGCMDASQYLGLASSGYHAGGAACAFYPAWPFLLRILRIPQSPASPLLAAAVAAVLSSLAAVRLHSWVAQQWGVARAHALLLVLCLHPSSLFYWLGFSESLFLFLVVLFVTHCESESRIHIALAGLACLLLPLTRAVGSFVILVPLMWLITGRNGGQLRIRSSLYIGAVLTGCAIYLLIFQSVAGNPFEGVEAQSKFANQPSLMHLADPATFLHRLVQIDDLHSPTGSFLDRFMFLGGLGLLIPLARIRPDWVPWAAAMLLIPAFTNWFLSNSRFTSTNLPLLLAAAAIAPRLNRPWAWVIAVDALLIQGWLCSRYFCFEWAS